MNSSFAFRLSGIWSRSGKFLFTNFTNEISAAVTFIDRTVTTAVNQLLTCTISGLSQNTPISWIDPDNNVISDSDTDNYNIDQMAFVFGNTASILTIKTAKLAVLSSGDVFSCKLKSAQYPDDSPDVVKEMTLTLLTLGKNKRLC